MSSWLRIPLRLLTFALVGLVAIAAVITGGYFYVEPTIPEAADLREVRFQTPSLLYTRDGRLMAQYGENKRAPVDYDAIPQRIKNAFLAAEDDRFFQHNGVDYMGIARGAIFAVRNLLTGRDERIPGGSTITQQVSRTAELVSREYDPARKFREVILAYRIEEEFTKEEIFELFLNTTFFGQTANGVSAAAQRYFDKDLNELTLSETAIIAGIPQGPSIMNPYNGPENAANRRRYVLRRMVELGFITQAERETALLEPIIPRVYGLEQDIEAGYVADMAYNWCLAKFGESSCDADGLVLVTTIDSRHQEANNRALREALEAYDRNHGYRGPIGRVELEDLASDSSWSDLVTVLDTLLEDYPTEFGAQAAVVLSADELLAEVYLPGIGPATIGIDAVAWARPYINDDRRGSYPDTVSDVLTAGDIVRFRRLDDGVLELAQIPDPRAAYDYVQGALISLDPMDGAVVSLSGGYNFRTEDQFNRATQALRQPGSSFKPFFYMSALSRGYTLATMVNDVGISEYSESLEERRRVRNYEGRYHGLVPVRYALMHSLNAAADQVVRDIGARYAADYLERFGFSDDALPPNASLALGGGNLTTIELAAAYAVLANGGYAVGIRPDQQSLPEPYFVDHVYSADGELLYDAHASVERVCPEPADDAEVQEPKLIEYQSQLVELPLRCAERVESAQMVYLITDVLKQVVQETSGVRARNAFPGRSDLAGKTGTTNEARDALFAGFNAGIVAVARVGFDDNRPLGEGEQGGRTAIPAWIEYMRTALDRQPQSEQPRPPGIVDLRINPETGLAAADCNRDVEFELFLADNLPPREPNSVCVPAQRLPSSGEQAPDGSDSPSSQPPSNRLFR